MSIVDIVVDCSAGDSGKGKVTHHLCKGAEYTHVLRFNGSGNAGHTIYHEGKRFVTHSLPSGLFHGVKSIIGSGCVVNKSQFFKEISELEEGGVNTEGLIFIASNAHVITDEHIAEDGKDTKIGTTKQGNGPAYRDKYDRQGILAKDVPELQDYIVDLYEEFHENGEVKILCEGAQGLELDVDWGDYPYVTSSHCTSAGALLNAIPHSWVRNVWGVAKIYETYVGAKSFEPSSAIFPRLRELGDEYGATTGRPRQCNWLNLDRLKRAININGATELVLNKVDILSDLGVYRLYTGGEEVSFETMKDMKDFIKQELNSSQPNLKIHFSGHKDRI